MADIELPRDAVGRGIPLDTMVPFDYVPTGPFADERRPGGAQPVREATERWNGHRDDWEGSVQS